MSERKKILCTLIMLLLAGIFQPAFADNFAAQVRYAELKETPSSYEVAAEFKYQLSPTAREAVQKGIPLTWDILTEIHQAGLIFNNTLYKAKRSYTLQFRALLNQYEVKSPGQLDMFLTLNDALNFMATPHDVGQIDKTLLKSDHHYELAMKIEFNREALPIPLLPDAYLERQWFLSSDWFVCSIPK